MKNTVLARRYAKALFEIASERKVLERLLNEVHSFSQSLDENPRFRFFLYSQDISQKEKTNKIEQVLQDRVSNIFFNFLLVLLRKKREFIFADIAREFQLLVDKFNKKIRASATTAFPLDAKMLSNLKSILDQAFGLDVQIDNQVDATILGGIIVNVDGKLLDGSLRYQLQTLKRQLLEKQNLN